MEHRSLAARVARARILRRESAVADCGLRGTQSARWHMSLAVTRTLHRSCRHSPIPLTGSAARFIKEGDNRAFWLPASEGETPRTTRFASHVLPISRPLDPGVFRLSNCHMLGAPRASRDTCPRCNHFGQSLDGKKVSRELHLLIDRCVEGLPTCLLLVPSMPRRALHHRESLRVAPGALGRWMSSRIGPAGPQST